MPRPPHAGEHIAGWLRKRLPLVEVPDDRRVPESVATRWLWVLVIWIASVALLGVVGYGLRLVLKP